MSSMPLIAPLSVRNVWQCSTPIPFFSHTLLFAYQCSRQQQLSQGCSYTDQGRLWARPSELPAGRLLERLKDDGILDCLLHFAAKGHKVVFCTNDKQFITRAQVASASSKHPVELFFVNADISEVFELTVHCNTKRRSLSHVQAQGLDAVKPAVLRATGIAGSGATPKAANKKRKQGTPSGGLVVG